MKIDDLDSFREAIKTLGFKNFWNKFTDAYLSEKRPDLISVKTDLKLNFDNSIFEFDNIGELYEIALEADSQISKKELGQYYTPKDTCEFMAKKTIGLYDKELDCLADVCCGTGNLIIEVLSLLGSAAYDVIKKGKVYLYDLDAIAMKIAVMKISILFIKNGDQTTFQNINKLIHTNVGNFLEEKITLPNNCVLISNPPYGKIPSSMKVWNGSETKNINDMYSVFIEKMAIQCKSAVIISPQSFIGGTKFRTLRAVLSRYGGYIFSFDNIPCPIFIGRKKGIFNTNKINSVRAAITVIDKTQNGFRLSPMIRFKADERKEMFEQLDNLLGDLAYSTDQAWTKIPKTLEPLVKKLKTSKTTIADLIEESPSSQKKELKITVPSTPRYFISGSKRDLSRSSKIELYANDSESFNKLYILINSTLSYLWWRIYDGGITLTKQTLMTLPVPDLSVEPLDCLVEEGINLEEKCLVNKVNAGRNNENIKFPEEYRRKINAYILSSMQLEDMEEKLYSIHSNRLLPIISNWM